MSDDERAIREMIATWMRASREGDTATVLSLMADDVVFLVPGRAPFGKEAFAGAQQGIAGVDIDGESDVREVKVLGDWAFAWAHLTVTMTPADASPAVRRSGHTLSIFQRLGDGRWVLARDANLLAVES
jgi:uncharacterized protein (TIGR02246 family)